MLIDNAFRIKALSLDDKLGVFYTDSLFDIKTIGFDAPIGSLILKQDGTIWRKIGVNNIDWSSLSLWSDSIALDNANINLVSGTTSAVLNGNDIIVLPSVGTPSFNLDFMARVSQGTSISFNISYAMSTAFPNTIQLDALIYVNGIVINGGIARSIVLTPLNNTLTTLQSLGTLTSGIHLLDTEFSTGDIVRLDFSRNTGSPSDTHTGNLQILGIQAL